MPVIVTNGSERRTRRDLADTRAIAQQVAQARVTAASNAATAEAAIETVATAVPPDLSDDIREVRRRLDELENQP